MIGERVRLAREACRFTQTELAEVAGVSQGTLSDLEAGRILAPAPEIIEAIAASTQFPTAFFYKGALPDLPEGHNRKLKRSTSKVSKQIRAQVRQIVEIVQASEQFLRLPPVAIDPFESDITLDDLEDIAQDTRKVMGVGSRDPIPNLTRAIERAGIVVVRLPTQMEDHDGFSVWPDLGLGGRPIIALSPGFSGDHDRFTEAHELGHLILHTRRSVSGDLAEKEAHRFAGALLLPEEAARESIRPPVTLRVLMAVKSTYGTSIATNAKRALDLQLITQDHFISLRKQISKRGWRTFEPVDVPQEQPLLISKVLRLAAGEGSLIQMANSVAMPPLTFRALVGK